MHSALCFVQKLVRLLVFFWFLSYQNIFFIFMLATVRQGGENQIFEKLLTPKLSV